MTRPQHLATLLMALCAVFMSSPAQARGPEVWALTEVRIVPAPGEEIARGTIVIRNGVIEAVGSDITPPADARILARPEFTAYPGLIDAYVETAWPSSPGGEDAGPGRAGNLIWPERAMADHGLPEAHAAKLRSAGFTTAAIAPAEGLFRGRSAVVNLAEGELDGNLLRLRHAQNVSFARNARGNGYPTSLMGSVALFRQTLLDAGWHDRAWAAYETNPAQRRPELDAALAELVATASGTELVVLEGDSALDTIRNGQLIREFDLRAHLVGSGDEYLWLEQIVAIGAPILVPVDFPEIPKAPSTDNLSVSLEKLRRWDEAPGNLRRLLDAETTVAVTGHRLDDPLHVLKNLYLAIDRGQLTASEALAALTTTPAKLLAIDDRAGTIAVGKMANLVLAEGELFAEKPSVREVWIDGRRFEVREVEPPTVDGAGTWDLTVTTGDGQTLTAVMILVGENDSLSGTITDPAGGIVRIQRAEISGARLEVAFDGTSYGTPGEIEFSLEIEANRGSGSGSSPAGSFTIEGRRSAGPQEDGR